VDKLHYFLVEREDKLIAQVMGKEADSLNKLQKQLNQLILLDRQMARLSKAAERLLVQRDPVQVRCGWLVRAS
jgi:hypothetical protein